MRRERNKKPRPPFDEEGLERLALFYAGRYATTRARLKSYLGRKLAERGWQGAAAPPLDRLAERFAELGYIDDGAFASARAASLLRRGYGERRIDQALKAAGIQAEDAEAARQDSRDGAWRAALRFAERKRIGPYAAGPPDRAGREKAVGAMLRAGHPIDIVRRVLDASAADIPDLDAD